MMLIAARILSTMCIKVMLMKHTILIVKSLVRHTRRHRDPHKHLGRSTSIHTLRALHDFCSRGPYACRRAPVLGIPSTSQNSCSR